MSSLNKGIIENFFEAKIFRLVYYSFDYNNIYYKFISPFEPRYKWSKSS